MRRLGIKSAETVAKAVSEPLVYLNDVMSAWTQREDARPVFGFKMMLHHDARVIDHIVSDPSWRVILLRRSDTLAQWSSLQIAKTTGEWGSKKKKARAKAGIEEPATRIEFKARVFEMYGNKLETRYGSLKRRLVDHQVFEIPTEAIDERRDEMLAFLGVDQPWPSPRRGSASGRTATRWRTAYTTTKWSTSSASTGWPGLSPHPARHAAAQGVITSPHNEAMGRWRCMRCTCSCRSGASPACRPRTARVAAGRADAAVARAGLASPSRTSR
jgi:hypothetical protein